MRCRSGEVPNSSECRADAVGDHGEGMLQGLARLAQSCKEFAFAVLMREATGSSDCDLNFTDTQHSEL